MGYSRPAGRLLADYNNTLGKPFVVSAPFTNGSKKF
jgi:hypothetical protein